MARTIRFTATFATAALLLLLADLAAAISCPGNVAVNYSPTEDISQTGTGTCITVTSNNVTVNLAGKTVTCNSGSTCSAAVAVNTGITGAVVKNGRVVNGTGTWTTGVLNAENPSTYATSTTVQDMTIDGAATAVANPYKVQTSVLKNATAACIDSGTSRILQNGDISQVYCLSSGDGIVVSGTSTSTNKPTIQRNYVAAASGTAIDASVGFLLVEHNIIDDATTYITSSADTTLSENLCQDAVCDEPGSNFSLTVNFTP